MGTLFDSLLDDRQKMHVAKTHTHAYSSRGGGAYRRHLSASLFEKSSPFPTMSAADVVVTLYRSERDPKPFVRARDSDATPSHVFTTVAAPGKASSDSTRTYLV